ncbi:MAG: TonB-dependent receptor [Archangium sp.]|nr:TonB-dependent receptor [Archangium sp.]
MLGLFIAVVVAQLDAGAPLDAGVVDDFVDPRTHTVVTGSRLERRAGDTVVATEVITRAQIEALGVRDLPQLLQQQPGVEMVYTNRGTGLRLQGMDPEYVLILIDGQRIAGRAGAFVDISRFSLREVERVEIVKGPSAALYGADAIGGVINLITRRPQQRFEGAARGMFGTLLEGDVRANVGSKLGAFELRGGGGFRTRNAFDWAPADVATSGPAVRRFDGDVELSWNPTESLRAWARTAYMRTDFTGVDLNDTGAVFDRRQRTEQYDVWFGVRSAFASATTVTARGHFGLFRDQFQLDQRASKALDDYSANLTRLGEAFVQVDQRLGRHTLTAGAEGYFERLLSDRIDPRFVARDRAGIFVQDSWAAGDAWPVKLALEPGFRVDVDSQFGAAPSPRLAVKIDPTPNLTVRASWGLGFRPPTFSELYLRFANTGVGYIVQGNPGLKAERSSSVNLSVDYRLPIDGWSLSASGWHTSVANMINVTAGGAPNPDNPTIFSYENVANAYTQGGELSARFKLSRGAVIDVGYMGLDARDVTRNRLLEGRSAHRVNVQATAKYRPLGFEIVIRGTLHSARPFYVGSGLGFANVLGFGEDRVVWAPAYVDLEAQLSYAVLRWLKVFVNGYNLLNQGDQSFTPRPPRGVLGGVTMEY